MISLIATVLNEGDNIHHLFDSIRAQTRPPDEIVIVDGGSSDDTLAIMQRLRRAAAAAPFRRRWLQHQPGAQPRHRRGARGDHRRHRCRCLRLDEGWLEKITAPLLADADLKVVGGFFLADPQSAFEAALGATTLPLAREIDGATFLPSSRSIAFRKAAADAIGGYPVWLDFCEDLVFDLRLRAQGGPFAFAPEALVYFRPRQRLRQFFRQYYFYARGDGKANLWPRRHLIRYLTYFALTPAIFIAGALIHPVIWLLYLIGAADYLNLPYRRLPTVMRRAPDRSWIAWLYCLALIPLIRFTGDLAKMIGYPVGWRWRLTQRPPDWRRADF